jgi:hypothetical protein
MKIADTRHDGGPDKGHGVDYDVVVILRFFPATAGDEVGTAWGEPSGEERLTGIPALGCGALLIFGVWEWPFVVFVVLCTLPCMSGAWPFNDCA